MNHLRSIGDAVARKIANSESIEIQNNISLFYCVLNVNEIAEHLAYYVRFIDYYSLKRVSKYLTTNALTKFYKLDSLVDLRIKDKSLFDIIDESKAVMSGSFILRILLATPYRIPLWIDQVNTTRYGDSWNNSDIDVYSHELDIHDCPTCDSQAAYSISSISPFLCNGNSLAAHEIDGRPADNNYVHNYDDTFEDFIDCNTCVVNKVKFNDIIIAKERDLADFIKKEFDFDFCKNYYSNGKLYISHPESVLKMKCTFPLKYFEVTYITPTEKTANMHTRQDKTLCLRFLKYINRGFNIHLQMTKSDKRKLYQYYNGRYEKNVHLILKAIKDATVTD